MASKTVVQRLGKTVNTLVRPLVTSPRWGWLVARWMTVVTYTGRRSGRTFTLPVGYRRRGDEVTIPVELPEKKSWWRNFLGDGAPLELRLDGGQHAGHALAHRLDGGRVDVVVRLDAPSGHR